MPSFGFGHYDFGAVVAPSMECVIRDYLNSCCTFLCPNWQVPVIGITATSGYAPGGVALSQRYIDDTLAVGDQAPASTYTGTIVQQAGLTALLRVDAIRLQGDCGIAPTVYVPDDLIAPTGHVQGACAYYPGLDAPAIPDAIYGEDFATRVPPDRSLIDPFDVHWDWAGWGEFGIWCALPGWVASMQYYSLDGVSPPYAQSPLTPCGWVQLYNLYILAACLPQGKKGTSTVLVPLSYNISLSPDSEEAQTVAWQTMRNEVSYMLEALEQGDGRVFGSQSHGPGGVQSAPTWWRMGEAGRARRGLL